MGNISTILAAIMCATTPLAAVEVTGSKLEQTASNFILGKETVNAIREAYEKGKYQSFLEEMDASYKEALSSGGLDGLIQMRSKQIPVDFQDNWEQKFIDLQGKKNADLLKVLIDNDDSVFAEKVRSLTANLSTPEQEKAISLISNLVLKAPQSGTNQDENKLIDIDLEYEYKSLQAFMPTSDTSPQERREYQTVLRMDKMVKMVEASKTFQDHALKQAVGLASANLDARLARNIDGVDLNAFVKGNAKPSNELEEKVTEILSSYQSQFSDLMKDIDAANR